MHASIQRLSLQAQRLWRCVIYVRHGWDYIKYRRKLSASIYGQIIPKNHPFFNRKFAAPYLANFLTANDRLHIQASLCDYLDTDFGPDTLVRQLKEGIELWRATSDVGTQSLILRLPVRTMLEGDLTLEYVFNGERLHLMSFAIVPGAILGLKEEWTVFIGGSQGAPHAATAMSQAARLNGEINAANMTLIGLRALCQSLDIASICGVTADSQPVVAGKAEPRLNAYDLLWQSQHGQLHGGFYLMPACLTYRDEDETGAANRARARRKRRLRMALTEQIRLTFDSLRSGETGCKLAAE